MNMFPQSNCLWFTVMLLSSCTVYSSDFLGGIYNKPPPSNRVANPLPDGYIDYWQDVKPILDKRCVTCHACYEAPCQLKLTAPEGIERGISSKKIYHSTRLFQTDLTRLFEDADSIQAWRDKGFSPILNEGSNTLNNNKQNSSLYQLLSLKENNPLPNVKKLDSKDFTFDIDRTESCPKSDEIDTYSKNHPLWGMPYALPGLAQQEQTTLQRWIEQGALYTPREKIDAHTQSLINDWEAFLNRDTIKGQLVSRYIYEHLFLAHLYFNESDTIFFKLIRSATPPEKRINRIATRRPYDDPSVDRVYYRLTPMLETPVLKTHIPYQLNQQRMQRWQDLFFNTPYSVDKLPGYDVNIAANPFDSFQALPVKSRYKFMLDEAQFTVMNFVKGASCHGQVAVNVIRDHFWVFFINPEHDTYPAIKDMQQVLINHLELPTAEGDTYRPLTNWKKYAAKEQAFLNTRDQFLVENFTGKNKINLDLIWDGDNENSNAALTVFRNFDNATVEKGLLGAPPKTAWVINYHLLERLHYLLVAGYDIYGNINHHLLSRLHMDFLRMEGEANFLLFLPQKVREQERQRWYQGGDDTLYSQLRNPNFDKLSTPDIVYATDNPKQELFNQLKKRLKAVLSNRRSLDNISDEKILFSLEKLAAIQGKHLSLLPEVSFIEIEQSGEDSIFITLLRNNARSSISTLLNEDKQLISANNTLTVSYGLVGAYPNVFMRVGDGELNQFVEKIDTLKSEKDYENLLDSYGIRRTNPTFWKQSDIVHEALYRESPIEYGVLDFSRLENR